MCQERGWNSSRLLLATPISEQHSRSSVTLHAYDGHYRPQLIQRWLYEKLGARVARLNDKKQLSHWLGDSCMRDVCVLLVSSLTIPPVFLSALSVKFTGRVRFGMTRPGQSGVDLLHAAAPADENENGAEGESPGRMIGEYYVSVPRRPSRWIRYGRRRSERPSFQALYYFLRWLRPDLNDVFMLSLAGVNMCAISALFEFRAGSMVTHLLRFFWILIQYNLAFLLGWLGVLAASHVRAVGNMGEQVLPALWHKCSTSLLSFRDNWQPLLQSPWRLITSYVAYCALIGWLRRRSWWPFSQLPADRPDPASVQQGWLEWLASYGRVRVEVGQALSPEELEIVNLLRSIGNANNNVELPSNPALPAAYGYIRSLAVWEHRPQRRLCLRCKLVKELNLRRLAGRLSLRPCGKCGYAGREDGSAREREREREDDCRICLSQYEGADRVLSLPCSHHYHQRCILPWLLSGHHVCPLCRWPTNRQKQALPHD